jgi:hypothetical protein
MSDVFALKALDYIRSKLIDVPELKDIRLFIRGSWPSGNVMQRTTPYCEFYIVQNPYNEEDVATRLDGFKYVGEVRFIDNLADNTGYTNWIDNGQGRVYDMPGYTQMVQWVVAARNELLKCQHNDLGDPDSYDPVESVILNVDHEHACAFSITQCILGFGLEAGQRKNTWYNVGQIQFEIRSQRVREE